MESSKINFSKLMPILKISCFLLLVLIAFLSVIIPGKATFRSFWKQSVKIQLVDDSTEDTDKEIAEALDDMYDLTDLTNYTGLFYNIESDQYEHAIKRLGNIKNKNTLEYYLLYESVLLNHAKEELTEEEKNELAESLKNFYQDAADRFPDQVHFLDMAGMYATVGEEYNKATYYLEKAYTMQPDNAMVNYHFGELCYQLGMTLECINYFNRAYDLGISDDKIASIESYFFRIKGKHAKEDE